MSTPIPQSCSNDERTQDAAKLLLDARRLRREMLDERLFGEPGWEILVALYLEDNGRRRIATTELSRLIKAPLTTSLRWLDVLERSDLIIRSGAHGNKSIRLVELSSTGRTILRNYFEKVSLILEDHNDSLDRMIVKTVC